MTAQMDAEDADHPAGGAPSALFLLWSNKHQMWWRPARRGYTANIEQAGRYGEAEALSRVLRSALCGRLSQVTCMVAAPGNWTAAHASPGCACGINEAGERYVDPICAALDPGSTEDGAP